MNLNWRLRSGMLSLELSSVYVAVHNYALFDYGFMAT